jgi:5-methylcytosine-specific restriction endonuclease McrA
MKKLETLEQIRARFANKEGADQTNKATAVLAKECPKCGQPVTIEKTQFFESEVCEHCLNHAQINHIELCCDVPDLHPVKLITSAGTIQVRNQCRNCGDLRPNSLGGFSKEQRESLPPVDEKKREDRQTNWGLVVKSFWNRVSEKRANKHASGKEQWMQAYNAYLNSPEWKAKRLMVLKRDNYLCQCCLNAYATQVHHKSYQFVDLKGNEPCFDLVAICVPCHEKIEEMKKQQRNL